jgi:hypothetical protein
MSRNVILVVVTEAGHFLKITFLDFLLSVFLRSHISGGTFTSTCTLFKIINFLSMFRLCGILSFPRNNCKRFF